MNIKSPIRNIPSYIRECGAVLLVECPAMMLQYVFLMLVVSQVEVEGQADGNPHGWDRRRRCDQQEYDPPCGPCEGVGGIPHGSNNDEIELTSCQVLGGPDQYPDPVRPVWGSQWTLPLAYEILIGKKNDAFCFQTFPGADSVGGEPEILTEPDLTAGSILDLCYRKQTGSKVYDMVEARAFREDLEIETVVGNMTSTVFHKGTNFWVVNTLPWYVGGIHQCICTHIRENFEGNKYYYPVQYNWVDNLVFVGREIIGIEFLNEAKEVINDEDDNSLSSHTLH